MNLSRKATLEGLVQKIDSNQITNYNNSDAESKKRVEVTITFLLCCSRWPRLPVGLHCLRSARNGHLCCRAPALLLHRRRSETWICRPLLSFVLCSPHWRQPAEGSLPPPTQSGTQPGQVWLCFLHNLSDYMLSLLLLLLGSDSIPTYM